MIGPDHRRTEVLLEESGVAWTLLRNQIYANGLPDQAEQIVREGKLVSFTPDARVAYVTREDCAAAAAAVLSTPGHDNKAYNITGPDAIGPRELVGKSPKIVEVYKTVARAALSSSPVLLLGESGTGKSIVARAIHENSQIGRAHV